MNCIGPTQLSKKRRLCIISRKAWWLFSKNTPPLIGGAEVQETILAKELVKCGWEIVILCEKRDVSQLNTLDGIKILPIIHFGSKGGSIISILNTCYTFIYGLIKSRCFICYQRNPDRYSGVIAIICRLLKKKYIIAGAHDRAFFQKQENNLFPKWHYMSFRIGVKLADKIIAQNRIQQQLILENFNRKSTIYHNIFNIAKLTKEKEYVLWVAGLMDVKRPEVYIQLANDHPDINFIMVASPRQRLEYFKRLRCIANGINNIKIYGHLPFYEADALFDRACLFVNTSTQEGFPNTFLQAWSRGVPVLSFVNPDNLLTELGLGVVANNYDDMSQKLDYIIKKSDYANWSEKIYKTYLHNFYSLNAIRKFEKILIE